jgi:hypothetical protein
MKRYTPEEKQFVRDNITGRSRIEMTELFNRRFGRSLTVQTMHFLIKQLRLRSGLPQYRFKPGHIPANKGIGCKPLGTERIAHGGYTEVKIAEPNVWKPKHIMLWEKAYGPVLKGHVVIFLDGGKSNISLDNLLMVSRAELALMNAHHLITPDKDLTKAGKTIADLKMLIRKRQKETDRTCMNSSKGEALINRELGYASANEDWMKAEETPV